MTIRFVARKSLNKCAGELVFSTHFECGSIVGICLEIKLHTLIQRRSGHNFGLDERSLAERFSIRVQIQKRAQRRI